MGSEEFRVCHDSTVDDGTVDDGTVDDGTVDDGTVDDGTADDGKVNDGPVNAPKGYAWVPSMPRVARRGTRTVRRTSAAQAAGVVGMAKWTRRDLVKAGLAASVAAVPGAERLSAQASPGPMSTGPGMQTVPIQTGSIQAGSIQAGSIQSGSIQSGSIQSGLRERLLMDYGWRFALGNANEPDKDFGFGKLRREGTYAKAGRVDGPAAPDFKASAWAIVDLPHDWAIDLPFVNQSTLVEHGGKALGREYPETSVGWYRREFKLPASDIGRRISVEFDGIFRNATVFFNGHYLAENMSGYAPLELDLSDFANFAGPGRDGAGNNVLVVRVDASLDEGWFYEGAGIYRHVWLTKTAPVHLVRWGTYVRTQFGSGGATSGPASVMVSTEVRNAGDAPATLQVLAAFVDAAGKTVATAGTSPTTIAAGEVQDLVLPPLVVASPALWSVETPNLYHVVTTVQVDGNPVDQEQTAFGIRELRFDAGKGFFLNGKSVKIKGTCNHQDHAGVGVAVPDRIQAYRIERLQWMGSNGCRTSHNPPTPEFLDACDRMGMLVMDETRMMSSNPEGLGQLERLIRRDRNHPSVILWSLGNEEPEQANTRGRRIVASMRKLQRKLDPMRLSTLAMNNGYGGIGASNVIDVQGFNYNDDQIDAYHQAHLLQPMIGTETASTLATRGIFAQDKVRGYMSAYDTDKPRWGNTAEEWWSFYDAREWLAGGFAWTGFDYRGETTPYKWPCISSHFGILDTCGFAKDTAWYYKTWWGSQPVLHLLPHWTWTGREGQEIEVWAYSNQESVELFLNGKSLGAQHVVKNGHLVWKVPYTPGMIEARASRGGSVVLTDKRETAGPAAKLLAVADRTTIAADGQDVAVVNVTVLDAQGRTVPEAGNLVGFAVSGPGAAIGVGNGDPSCHEPDRASQRSAFNGLCMAIVQGKRGGIGTVSVEVTSPGLAGATVTVACVSSPLPSIVA